MPDPTETNPEVDIGHIVNELVRKHYPTVAGVILTGSQTDPGTVTPQSDIDIVLIDEMFSGVTTHSFRDGKYKLDFTKVSYTDMYRVFIDYAYDHRGTILHMISTGRIIYDKFRELKFVQQKTKELYSLGNASVENELRVLKNNLAKIKKNILKDLDFRYKFFLTIEFAHQISSAYILSNQGWFPSSSYRRTGALLAIDKTAGFIDGLMELVQDSFKEESYSKERIINFIDRYLNQPFTSKTPQYANKLMVVNLRYRSQSLKHFYSSLLPQLIADPYLEKVYLYSQRHDYMHVFKYNFVLVFNSRHPEFNESQILKRLYEIAKAIRRPIVKLNIVSGEFLFRQFVNPQHVESLCALLQYISAGVYQTVKPAKTYDKAKFMLLGQVLLVQLASSLGITGGLFVRLMKYLLLKWRSNNSFLLNADYKKIVTINVRIEKRRHRYYNANQAILDDLYRSSWTTNSIHIEHWDLDELFERMTNYATALREKDELKLDTYIVRLLRRYLQDESRVTDCYLYILTAESVLNVLNIEKSNFGILAYNLLQSELKRNQSQAVVANDAVDTDSGN